VQPHNMLLSHPQMEGNQATLMDRPRYRTLTWIGYQSVGAVVGLDLDVVVAPSRVCASQMRVAHSQTNCRTLT
jgi:hypothetical protein